MQLLFVPALPPAGDKVQKERQYAACKAHTARNAHRKRRQDLDRLVKTARTGSEAASYCGQAVLMHPAASVSGSLDPFNCQRIARSPLLDEAVSFVRVYHTASWSAMHTVRWFQDDRPNQDKVPRHHILIGIAASDWLWEIFIADAGVFGSVVASALPLLKPLTLVENARELENLGLQLKAKGLFRLRQTLQSTSSDFPPRLGVIYHVKALFRESSMNGDLENAAIHAKILVWLVDKLPIHESSGTNFLRIALWGDAIPALLQLRRPVLSYHQWMPNIVSTIWSSAESKLPDFQNSDTLLPDYIRSASLRQAFLHAWRALELQLAFDDGRLERTELIFHWIVTKAESHICTLLNLYFDLVDSNTATKTTPGERHTEAALVLSLLYVYQKAFGNVIRADGVDMHESAGVVHQALVVQAKSALAQCSHSERLIYREAHCWLLFVGVCCEERLGECIKKSVDSEPRRWFHQQLSLQVSYLGLKNWADVRSVLGRLVFPEFLVRQCRCQGLVGKAEL